ncbi:MAG: hypothetical protein LBD56_00305 [Endomicrobium sp.]|jgi:hypothetical protein|nr:hypothetical protein [Endomicrobium sp.]
MNVNQPKPDVNAKAKQLITQKENKQLVVINTHATNALHGKRTFKGKNGIANESAFEYANGQGLLLIKDYEKQIKKFGDSTLKTLNCTVHLFTKQNSLGQDIKQIKNEIEFKVRDYQKLRGLKNYKATKEQLTNDLNLLLASSLKYNGKSFNGKKVNTVTIGTTFISDFEINNGNVSISFAPKFAEFLVKSGFLMLLPEKYFSMPPITSQILCKLCFHTRINQKRDKKRGFSITGVESLLEAVSNIPSHEDVIKGNNRRVSERIIEPLINGLDECHCHTFLKWEFSNAKGKPLTSEQLEGLNRKGNIVETKSKKDKYYLKWDIFKKLYIRYTLNTPIETTAVSPTEELPPAK